MYTRFFFSKKTKASILNTGPKRKLMNCKISQEVLTFRFILTKTKINCFKNCLLEKNTFNDRIAQQKSTNIKFLRNSTFVTKKLLLKYSRSKYSDMNSNLIASTNTVSFLTEKTSLYSRVSQFF